MMQTVAAYLFLLICEQAEYKFTCFTSTKSTNTDAEALTS